jgi:GcrA cell cycle regulator
MADPWSDEREARLVTLWYERTADGRKYANSQGKIGRLLGVSKNAVIGKRNRLGLPARGEFTKKPKPPPETPAKRQPKTTLAPLSPSPEPPAPKTPPHFRTITCCWPIGEPGTRAFRFCDAVCDLGKSYCADHARLSYVKVRDRREDHAGC